LTITADFCAIVFYGFYMTVAGKDTKAGVGRTFGQVDMINIAEAGLV
jgi:hypothetical protein